MFTDLAPMDVLLQRFGRLHRHRDRDGVRPPGFERARAIVLTGDKPLDSHLRRDGEARGPHGVGTVYDNALILEATYRCLIAFSTLRIPEQNRELVEQTTHPEALEKLADQLGGAWTDHLRRGMGKRLAHVGLADLNLVDRSAHFGEYSFRTTDVAERIATRLGEGDRRAVFQPPQLGPFGSTVREMTLPAWLTRGAPGDLLGDPDLLPSDVRAETGVLGACVRFSFATLPFVYDRLGLRPDRTPRPSKEDVSARA